MPRTTSFGPDEFERFPKGTTCFLAPRELLTAAFEAYRSGYMDLRHANDDTPVIRWLAARQRINISPGFGCSYASRSRFLPFVTHAFHRGTVFVDGHGRRESRWFPIVVGLYAGQPLGGARPSFAAVRRGAVRRQPRAAAWRWRFASSAARARGDGHVLGHAGLRRRPRRGDVAWSRLYCVRARSGAAGMILVIYGTTGELIKLMPVLAKLQDSEYPFIQTSTGQQVNQIPRLLQLAGLPPVDLWLARGASGRDLRANRDIPGWAATVAGRYVRGRSELRRQLRSGPGKPLVLVHGDTMTTLYGAALGRLLGAPVAHVESGLRSFDLMHPFPEELNRRVTSRVASLLYAPGAWPASNLHHGTVVDTGSNTIRDSLDMVNPVAAAPIELPDGEFGIASLHRFELLKDRRLLEETIELLSACARPILWVDHPVTIAALERHGLSGRLGPNIRPIPRLDFFGFVAVMRQSSFLVTDSGGSQEETFYLDIPCLVHRKRTERREGLGENVVLSGYDASILREFLNDPEAHRRRVALPPTHPSDVIVNDLAARGFAAAVDHTRAGREHQ